MATDLATPSNQLVKMRWKEPYVSEGLNKKLNGVVPAGVIRGGRLTTSGVAMSVTVQADPNTNDSIYSFIDSNGHQLTFRQENDVTIGLSAVPSQTVYIGLEVTYLISAATVVKWRAYSLAEVQADPTLVILGRVDVPASGLIPSGDIYPEERRDAWMNISPHMREWKQVVKNGDFEIAELSTSFTTFPGHQLPQWTTGGVGAVFDFQVVRTDPYEGLNHLQVTGSSSSGIGYIASWGVSRVTPGALMHILFAIKGVAWGGVGANGCQGISISFYADVQTAPVSTVFITDNSLSGNFPWQEIGEIIEVPATAQWCRWAVFIDDDSAAPSGVLYFDAVRVFVEQGWPTESNQEGEIREETVVANMIHIPPPSGGFANLAEYMSRTLGIRMTSWPAPFQYWMQHLLGDLSWDLSLKGGGLDIDRAILGIGDVFTPDASKDVQATRRMRFSLPNSQLAANAHWVLIWEGDGSGVGRGSVRVYASTDNYDGNGPGFNITMNARYDANALQWVRDITANSAMYVFTQDRYYRFVHESTQTSPWGIGAWQHALVNEYYSNTNDRLYRFLHDCYTQIINTTSTQSNPAYGASTAANATYAKNIVKAWGFALTNGAGGFTSREGFGCDMSLTGTGRMTVTLKDAMDSGNYAVAGLINPNVVPPNVDWAVGLSFWNMAAASFELTGVDRPSALWVNFDTATWQITFIVLGQQTT